MTTRLVLPGLLGALLVPALASAQPTPNDPNAPTPTEVPPPPPPAPPSPPDTPAPDSTTVHGPAVIVTPPAPVVATTPGPEYRIVYDSYNAPVFASGAVTFAISYGASVITASTTDNDRGNHRLYVPVVGPWLALNDRGSCDITRASC